MFLPPSQESRVVRPPLKRADSHTQQPIETTGTRRRNIAHRLGAGPFLHTLLGQQKSMASGGTRPAGFSFNPKKRKSNRSKICCPQNKKSKRFNYRNAKNRFSGKNWRRHQPQRFRQIKHQVHVLYRLTCGTFHQIIDRSKGNNPPRPFID